MTHVTAEEKEYPRLRYSLVTARRAV